MVVVINMIVQKTLRYRIVTAEFLGIPGKIGNCSRIFKGT